MPDLLDALLISPVIAAVKNEKTLAAACGSGCGVVFMLKGNICTIKKQVDILRRHDKQVYLHIELMEGFGRDRYALEYIRDSIAPTGIITTKPQLVRAAVELGIPVIQRIFLIDSQSFHTGVSSVGSSHPSAVEIMPGVIPALTRKICAATSTPVITGGMIETKADILASLSAGAVGVSTSAEALWAE